MATLYSVMSVIWQYGCPRFSVDMVTDRAHWRRLADTDEWKRLARL